MSINSKPYDGRIACQQIGFCFQGCKSGAKWSSGYVSIPKGEATGKLEVRTHAQVLKIEHGKDGKVNGVVYADKKELSINKELELYVWLVTPLSLRDYF